MKWDDEKVVTLNRKIAGKLKKNMMSWRSRFDQPAFSRVSWVIMPPVVKIWTRYCSSIIYQVILEQEFLYLRYPPVMIRWFHPLSQFTSENSKNRFIEGISLWKWSSCCYLSWIGLIFTQLTVFANIKFAKRRSLIKITKGLRLEHRPTFIKSGIEEIERKRRIIYEIDSVKSMWCRSS